MMRDAIERAATDMFHSIAGGTCQFVRFDELLDIQKQTWRDGAKAAILAFLAAAEEPTPAIDKAVEDGALHCQNCWRAAVSALRREIEGEK